jgi:hypothetical protein
VKTRVIACTLLIAGAMFAQFSVGIRIGAPPPVRVVRVQPRNPGNEYMWIAGYWYPVGNHYKWHDGYWTRPAYVGAQWVAPHHDGQQYFEGYWEGERGKTGHDHRSDRDRSYRDFKHDRN